jgi:hypothetical protein
MWFGCIKSLPTEDIWNIGDCMQCVFQTHCSPDRNFVIKTTNFVFPANSHISNTCNEIQFASLFVYIYFPKHVYICGMRRRVGRGTVETDWFKDLNMSLTISLYPSSGRSFILVRTRHFQDKTHTDTWQ